MRRSDRDLWGDADWGTGAPSPTGRVPEGRRIVDVLRAGCTPANLAVAAMLATGWVALLGWSGAGPDGWQARLCAGLDEPPRSCGTVRLRGDETRVVPHEAAVRSAS